MKQDLNKNQFSTDEFDIVNSLPFPQRKKYNRIKSRRIETKLGNYSQITELKLKKYEDLREEEKKKRKEDMRNIREKVLQAKEEEKRKLEKKQKKIKRLITKRKEEREDRINNGDYFKYSPFVDFEKLREPSYDSEGNEKPKEKILSYYKQKNEEEILEEMERRKAKLRKDFSHKAIRMQNAKISRDLRIRKSENLKRIRR